MTLNYYEERFEHRRKQRERKRKQRRQRRRIRNTFLGVSAALILILIGKNSTKDHYNAEAEELYPSDSQIASEVETDQDEKEPAWTGAISPSDQAGPKQKANTKKIQAKRYTQDIDCFLLTKIDTAVYDRPVLEADKIAVVPVETYLESYGTEDGYTKVKYMGQVGYIRDKALAAVPDPTTFKVVDGHVIVNKKYSLDPSYETSFDENAASALRVMMEAMERDGLKIEPATEYRSAADESKEIVLQGRPQGAPEPGHAVFQTGYGVSFCVPGTDPRIDNKFEESEQFAWLKDHAHEYGYILRYPKGSEKVTGYRADPTIFYYVGIDDARQIKTSCMTMEEYYGLD